MFYDKISLMYKIKKHWKKILVSLLIIIVVSVITAIWIKSKTVLSPVIPKTNQLSLNKENGSNKVVAEQKTIEKPVVITPPKFNKSLYSTTDSTSIWTVTNKQHPLVPINYVPIDLVNSVGATISTKGLTDFEAMNNAALAAGVNFTIVSSYRSYDTQNYLYNNYVATYGQTASDTFSARPGYSEHQTGLALDFGSSTGAVCNLDDCFGSTTEGAWLAQHAYEYGFLLRYPSDKQQITGYKSEPWHFRYIGKDLALEMKNNLIFTLEEFFGISGGESYS
jgi:D-alanyl-D-alanine carboxypeptidase